MSTIACFGVLAGGTAYAAATIGSAEVINESLLSEDVKNGTLGGGDLKESTIASSRIVNDSLLGADVKNNSLTGDDINEPSLTGIGAVRVTSFGRFTPDGEESFSLVDHTINVPSSGRLFVVVQSPVTRVTCETSCGVEWGIYVDNEPVLGSRQGAEAGAGQQSPAQPYMAMGSREVGPGAREVEVRMSGEGAPSDFEHTMQMASIFIPD
jgi:hypothetical protein